MKINPHTTLKCVADYVGAKKMIGDPNFVISGLNEIHEVEPGDITFVDHPKYYNKALNSAATTIIINSEEVECPECKNTIELDWSGNLEDDCQGNCSHCAGCDEHDFDDEDDDM